MPKSWLHFSLLWLFLRLPQNCPTSIFITSHEHGCKAISWVHIDVQLLNALSPILCRPLLSRTVANETQLKNARSPMEVTDDGIMIWRNDVQRSNAHGPIFWRIPQSFSFALLPIPHLRQFWIWCGVLLNHGTTPLNVANTRCQWDK
jgi:hypothetical protein